jgi:hypothetical protein
MSDPGQVQWSRLSTAHGSAVEVPTALADLVAEDPNVRERAYWKLDNHVVLQGDLYEAAPFVGMALVEMLARGVDRKDRLYALLYQLVEGYAPPEMTVVVDGRPVPLAATNRRIVEDGLRWYEQDLLSPEPAIRAKVIDILSSFRSRTAEALGALKAAREQTRDKDTIRHIDEAIEELEGERNA